MRRENETWEEYEQRLSQEFVGFANNILNLVGAESTPDSISTYTDKWGYSNVSISFSKASTDDELRIVFGKAGVVDMVDADGDVLDEASFEKAIYHFMENYGGKGEENHQGIQKGKIVASWYDKVEKAWLVGYKVYDDQMWEDVKKGEYSGFSFGGTGTRKPVEEDK